MVVELAGRRPDAAKTPNPEALKPGVRTSYLWRRRRESNPLLLGASEAPIPMGLIPVEMRTGGVEPPQREAARLQPAELSECSASARNRVAGRVRTGAARITTANAAAYTTATMERGRPDSNRRPLARQTSALRT
jgi:hypothetical protein